jgi:hypothetical protein
MGVAMRMMIVMGGVIIIRGSVISRRARRRGRVSVLREEEVKRARRREGNGMLGRRSNCMGHVAVCRFTLSGQEDHHDAKSCLDKLARRI